MYPEEERKVRRGSSTLGKMFLSDEEDRGEDDKYKKSQP